MTHSWFLAIIGLLSTIFVKVDPILRFWPNFHKIAIFTENPPENGRKIFFRQFCNFFLKIYPYLDSFDQFKALEVISALNYSQTLFLRHPNLAYLGAQNAQKWQNLGFLNKRHFAKNANFAIP